MDIASLTAFAAAFLVFAASPGPDNVTIMARTVSHGAAAGIAYGAGTVTGILAFLFLAVFGLSLVAEELGVAMTVLRYAGAAYLVWMGVRLWFAEPVSADHAVATGRSGLVGSFATGVLLNLGNPKMPLFYIALLPNVVGPNLTMEQAGVLALVIVAVEVLVIGGHVVLAGRARAALKRTSVLRRVNRGCGAVMVGAGVAAVAVR
ncbi:MULTISPECIES: LysE family translocator [unclassified Rhizobium]|uniref:LysE family translocator n=1 Tax=unclassified Rhizobium TaxID=2613769 RepID=UPI001AE3B13B|nr:MULTISPECIES: LysE family translocator [unclassified Rhizobium]MBP2461686.1 threonine/homoserine/homoserine lactone efflux protein [Rhizobium sp. PvP014]MBP2529081.1 threonine/homoserine/homoserine lactone efflux protein [Rhizobium sp. PvP099]